MDRPMAFGSTMQHRIAILLMCVAGFGWALSSAVARLVPQDMPLQQMVWGRYGVHLLLLLVFVWPRRRASLWRTERPGAQVVRGLMMLAMPALFVLGAVYLPVGDVWAVVWLAPALAAGLGVLKQGEKPPIWTWSALTLGFAGMAIAFDLSSGTLGMLAVLLPLGSGLAFAVFQVMSRALRAESTSTGVLYTALCVVVPLTFVPGVLQRPSAEAVVVCVGMGLTWLLVLVSIDEALKRAPLAWVAPFLYSELLWSILIRWLAFDEPMTRRSLAGASLVAVGCLIGAISVLRTDHESVAGNEPP